MEGSFGVCRLSIVSVKNEPHPHAPQLAQLLFGDHYQVLAASQDSNWLKILVHFDRVEGWIDAKHHHAITPEYFDQINSAEFKITTDVCSTILYKKATLSIVIGSIVPISQSELFKMEEQFAFNGESKAVGQKREFEFVKTIALKYLNAPEQAGGKTPFGISACGLVQMIYKIGGYSLPFFAEDQSRCGKNVNRLLSAKAGDLVIFKSRIDKALSSGFLLEDHKVLHVDGRAKIDQVFEDGNLDLETKIFTHELHCVKRILND